MMARTNPSPRDIFLGELKREYIYTADQEWILDSPGGNALYAAVGYQIWEKKRSPGICTRVGEDYPQSWLEGFSEKGINTEGVVVLPRAMDLRSCIIVDGDLANQVPELPRHLAGPNSGLPAGLIGYPGEDQQAPTRRTSKPTAIREQDLPRSYRTATGAHLCSLDYLSHHLLPAVLRKQGFSTITLHPDSSYMDPSFFNDIPSLITGLTGFISAEEDLLNLYKGRTADLWKMAEDLGRYGCELIVIQRGTNGCYLYESAPGTRWEIPGYPSRLKNPLGGMEAFCGGFLAGLRQTQDPLEAGLFATVAYSLMVEGNGPFYPLKAIPGLAAARLDYIRDRVSES